MKSILLGAVAAVIVAVVAFAVLDSSLQVTAEERFTTEGVRL